MTRRVGVFFLLEEWLVELWLVEQRFPCLKSNTEPHQIGWTRHPRTSMNFVVAFVFLVKFHIMVTSFVLLTLKISYWSFIFCKYQRLSSIKPQFLGGVRDFEHDEKMINILKILEKISGNSFSSRNCKFNASREGMSVMGCKRWFCLWARSNLC